MSAIESGENGGRENGFGGEYGGCHRRRRGNGHRGSKGAGHSLEKAADMVQAIGCLDRRAEGNGGFELVGGCPSRGCQQGHTSGAPWVLT